MSVPRCIVVGVDGSECARRALVWTAALVEGADSEVLAVHARGLLTHLGPTSVVPSVGVDDDVMARLEQQWCQPLSESAVSYRCLVVDGEPVHALLGAARQHGADLVVVGRRGAGGHPGLVIGSTSQQLVHQADIAVVVVPPEPSPA